MNAIVYSEEMLAHQEPFQAVSQWQQWNDCDGNMATWDEVDLVTIGDEKITADLVFHYSFTHRP